MTAYVDDMGDEERKALQGGGRPDPTPHPGQRIARLESALLEAVIALEAAVAYVPSDGPDVWATAGKLREVIDGTGDHVQGVRSTSGSEHALGGVQIGDLEHPDGVYHRERTSVEQAEKDEWLASFKPYHNPSDVARIAELEVNLAPKEALGGGADTWPGGLGRMLAGRDRRSEDRSRPLEEESSSEIA